MPSEGAPRVAVAFVQGAHHDVGNMPARRRRRAARSYAESIYVTFASLLRWNNSVDPVLVTDRAWHWPLPAGVRVSVWPFRHQAPLGPSFSASMFTLDALESLDGRLDGSASPLLMIDPDCVVTDSLNPLFATCEGKIGAYPLDHEPDDYINGLTRSEAARLAGQLDSSDPTLATHYGGEAYFFERSLLTSVRTSAEAAYSLSVDRAKTGKSAFTTEEHILSYSLRHVPVQDLSPYVKRIWTAASYNTVEQGDTGYIVWHLPAEKGRGFRRAYKEATNPDSWFWSAPRDDWAERMGALFGLERTLTRRTSDGLVGMAGRARRRLLSRRNA